MTQLEITILGIVREKPCHAYQIEKVIKERDLRQRMNIGFSTIYSILRKMEHGRLVESSFIPQENLPGRRVYGITAKGKILLIEEVKKALSRPKREPSFFETGLANSDCLSKSELREALSIYEAEIVRLIQIKVKEITGLSKKHVIERALHTRPLSLLQTERRWIKELMSLL